MIGRELLDDPRADPAAVRCELHDIGRLNVLFGGTRAVVRELEQFFDMGKPEAGSGKSGASWTLLDVGTGSGDIAIAAAAVARRCGVDLKPVGVELNRTAARLARGNGMHVVLGDGNALPFGPKSRASARCAGSRPWTASRGAWWYSPICGARGSRSWGSGRRRSGCA